MLLTLAAIPADAEGRRRGGARILQTNLANRLPRAGSCATRSASKFERHLYENIVVGRYLIDLGNVICGQHRAVPVPRLQRRQDAAEHHHLRYQKNLRPFGFKLSTDRVDS
jgi:hypothetical protein